MTIQAPARPGSNTTESRRRLATIDEVRRDLLPLPKSSIYDLARYGKLPGVVRVGKRVLFDVDQLEAWIDAGGARTTVGDDPGGQE